MSSNPNKRFVVQSLLALISKCPQLTSQRTRTNIINIEAITHTQTHTYDMIIINF